MLPGERLGPYEIVAPLGAGGMGVVYSARDTRLGRTVAIKLTPERFSDRFEREARAISALNHPNICQLYDVGPNFLVMELVDGAPVAAVDTLRKLLDLAVQMADGLAAAHAAGVVHRDLKPDNILVTRDGRVKILDFGLATERRALAGTDDARTMTATEPGMILGTVNYMSPEQARGLANVGAQSDQFSLGLVLYELASGRRAFRRDSATETLAAIIRDEPDPLPATTPAPLRWIIGRLLSKDPADRYESTRDLFRELRQVRDHITEATSPSAAVPTTGIAPVGRRRLSAAIVAAVGAGAVLGGAVMWLVASRPAAPPQDLSTFTFTPIATDDAVSEGTPVWAPKNGKSIAYLAGVNRVSQLFTQAIGSMDAVQITHGASGVSRPFWSPDESSIYFTREGALWVVGSAGGTPDRLFEIDRAVLHPNGKTILFQRGRTFWVGVRGEEPREFTLPEEMTKLPGEKTLLGFSPDGSKLAFLAGQALWIVPYPSGPARRVIADPDFTPAGSWMPDSRRMVLIRRIGSNHDALSMIDTSTGNARVFYALPADVQSVAVSPDGTALAYSAGRNQLDVVEVSIADGRVRTLQATGAISAQAAWASRTRYLYAISRGGGSGIYEASVTEGFTRRIIDAGDGLTMSPRPAPDGSQFLFSRNVRGGPPQLMISNSSGQMSPLDPSAPGYTTNGIWSAKGEHVIYLRTIDGQRTEVARIRPGSTAPPEILATYPFRDTTQLRRPLAASPLGDVILAQGGPQLFLVALDFKSERPLTSQRIGSGGGRGFSKDGREVLAIVHDISGDGSLWQLWAVDVTSGRERLVTNIDLPVGTQGLTGFSLHPDGTRFLASAVGGANNDIWMLTGFDRR